MDFKTGILVMLVGIAMLGITMNLVSAFVPAAETSIYAYCDDPHGCYSTPYPKTCWKMIGWDLKAECEVNAYDSMTYTKVRAYATYYSSSFPFWLGTEDKVLGLPKHACGASAWAKTISSAAWVKTSLVECK